MDVFHFLIENSTLIQMRYRLRQLANESLSLSDVKLNDEDYAAIEYSNWIRQTIKNSLFYLTAFFGPVGFLLNLMMIAVFARSKFQRNTTMGFYYIVNNMKLS